MSNDTYTIKQVAEIKKVSEQTIRRRIKDGTLPADKVTDEYGIDRWHIPTSAIDVPIEIKDVIPMTRQVSVLEIQAAMQNAITMAVQKEIAPLLEENKKLAERIEELSAIQKGGNNQILELRKELEAHNRRTDERLREVNALKKTWWKFW